MGSRWGQLDLPLPDRTIAEHKAGIYKAFQEAIDEAGGTVWLAASMEKPHPGVSLRVRNAPDSKGDTQEATFAMLAHLGPDTNARLVFLAGLCELWGCEPPVARRTSSVEQRLEALLAELEEANGVGKAILERAARRLRSDAGEFRR